MKTLLLLVLSLFAFSVSSNEEQQFVSVKRLTMESALQIADGAIKACRKKGIQVGVTVVDRNGITQVALRDVLAPTITLPVSYKKAYTSVSFMAATSALKRQASSPLAHVEDMFFGGGGLVIQAAGQLLGGVGVSGAPSGELDEECAQAGINSIIDDLEMSM